MKGTSILFFIITISMGFVLLFFIIFLTYNYYKNTQNSLRDQVVNQVASEIISEILDVYFIGSKINTIYFNESMVVLEKKIKIPEKINGENYYVEGISSTGIWNYIKINDTYSEKIFANKIGIIFKDKKYYFDIPNVQISLAGRIRSGENNITYLRYKYGNSVKNAIILGNFDTIIDIEKIQ